MPWGSLILVAVLVIAAHALLLGSVDGFALMRPSPSSEVPRSVQVSMVAAAPPEIVLPAEPLPVASPPPKPRPKPKPRPRPKPAPAPVIEAPTPDVAVAMAEPLPAAEPEPALAPEPAASAASEPAPEASAALASAAPEPAASTPPALAAPASAASAPPEPIPVYPTTAPPAFTFIYDLSRSPLRGNGALIFQLTDDGYEARLQGTVAGFSVLEWISRGSFDGAGFAPLRFTEQRLRRAPTAANFQRAAGKITYSASTDEVPLPPGAQDRLSWMLQLASIAQARPDKLVEGARITMFVTGVRADAEVWSFRVIGNETVRTPLGTLETVHLLREARFPHDTRADVWLDPSRHHLPARARLSSTEDGSDAFELALREAPSHLP